MKDINLILEKIHNCGIQELAAVTTIEQAIDILVMGIMECRGVEYSQQFKKFGKYAPEYVETNYTTFYKMIEKDVVAKDEKALIRAKRLQGLSQEQAKAEIERERLLESLGNNRIIGYARVSTREQNLDRQIKALKESGCQYIFEEKKSGKNTKRNELQALLSYVKAGDTVIVSELTRVARSTADLHSIVETLANMGVGFKSLKESFIDTTTATGKLMLSIMAGIAQFEREIMLERQAEGYEIVKEQGVKMGRPLQANSDLTLALQLVEKGEYTQTQICKMTNISRTTLWRELKKLEEQRAVS